MVADNSLTFNSSVARLKERAGEFASLYQWLWQNNPTDIDSHTLNAEYTKMMKQGSAIKSAVSRVTGGVDWANGAINSVFGDDETFTNGLNGLPIIMMGVVGITTGIAAMTKWISDAYILKSKIEYAREQHQSGSSIADIDAVLNGSKNPSTMGLLILLGVGAWGLYRAYH